MRSGDRIIFDVSSIARWTGPAVGIVRVEHALATHALTMRPDIMPSIYDSNGVLPRDRACMGGPGRGLGRDARNPQLRLPARPHQAA